MKLALAAGFLALSACIATDPLKTVPNPCATPGADYAFSLVGDPGGTCGPELIGLLNVENDGTLGDPFHCNSVTRAGCGVHNGDCRVETNGTSCTVNVDVAFASDGTSASGTATASCSNASSSCASSYRVQARQQ